MRHYRPGQGTKDLLSWMRGAGNFRYEGYDVILLARASAHDRGTTPEAKTTRMNQRDLVAAGPVQKLCVAF